MPLLDEIAFRDRSRALADLERLSQDIPSGIRGRIEYLLAGTADPDGALHYLGKLSQQQPHAFHRLTRAPGPLQSLLAVFSHSQFLSEEILQHPEWLEELPASFDLHRVLGVEELSERLERWLAGCGDGPPPALSLAEFRRRQLLRILLRDVQGLATLAETTEEISNLADAILDVTYRRIRAELVRRHGEPQECGFTVISLGKLGGRELNYSSDIDLMFVFSGAGETNGAQPVSNKEFFKKVANQYTELLSTYTAEGLCYRVDLRLRPDGRLGEVCISLDGARQYYRGRARDWELQMLIKARVSAGEPGPGRELLDFVEPLIYSSTLDFSAVEAVSVTRMRISEKLAGRRGDAAGFDIKLAPGGIRDIEFLVQCLQRLHGGREPWVRHGGTLHALARLRDKDLLSASEYSRLVSAYQFLRHLEHRLQFAEDRQTHVLPKDPDQQELIARRMPASEIGNLVSSERLLQRLNAHLEEVQDIYERVIHAQRPTYYGVTPLPEKRNEPAPAPPVPRADAALAASNLVRFLDQRAPGLRQALLRGGLRRGARAFEHFLERVLPNPDWLAWLDGDPTLVGYVFDLFEHSAYFTEQLIRRPDFLEELRRMRLGGDSEPRYADSIGVLSDAADLRRSFGREMLRLEAASICLHVPIFVTLGRTSELADAAIAAAYRMALEQLATVRPPASAAYTARDQMMVVALGRLGMREFDLASDADLVFVLPDEDAAEHAFWSRVAERMIEILNAYTGEGVMFAVDTRLRPNGREGELVQLERTYKDYFEKNAEAWEGITYMKSRAVAGNIDRATQFLSELQQVDWRRYGQSGRSKKQLRQMRQRLEKEQGGENPLKAGRGGYYDIDFAMMYLRLKGAGIFFKVLNTPERIDVVEKMGHLERADAEFLRDAATFYRAVDHAMRVSTGQAAVTLPTAPTQLEQLTELVTRWTPDHLHDQPLNIELTQIQERTREYFDRLFG